MWTPTIYIAGNVGIFQQLLTGMNLIFDPQSGQSAWSGGGSGSSAFFNVGVLIQLAMLVGVLGLAARGILSQRHEWHHALLGLFAYVALFTPTTSVILDDLYTGNSVIVDHIPIGIAYPAGLMSAIGYYMTNEIQQATSSVNGAVPPITLANGGFAAPLKDYLMLRAAPENFVKMNENMAHTIITYAEDCVADSSSFSMSADVNDSSDILGSITTNYNSANRTVEYTNANPWGNTGGGLGGVLCATAATDVQSLWTAFTGGSVSGASTNGDITTVPVDNGQGEINVRSLSSLEGALIDYNATPGPNATANAGTTTSTTVNNNLDTILPNCSGNGSGAVCSVSNDGAQFINNEILGCMATDGYNLSQAPYAAQSNGTLEPFCLADAVASTAGARGASLATLFESNVMAMESILQFLFFGLTPLVAVMFAFNAVQGQYALFGKYVQFGVWTQSFLPAVAIINDYSQYQVQHAINRMVEATGNTSAPFTFMSMSTGFSHVSEALMSANMMVTMAPLITLAVITGSYYSLSQLAKNIGTEYHGAGAGEVGQTLAPKIMAPAFNEAPAAYGETSTGGGVVSGTNVGVKSAPTMNYGTTLGATATAAYQAMQQQTATASAQFATQSQTAVSYALSHGNDNSFVRKAGEEFNAARSSEQTHASALAQSFGMSNARAMEYLQAAAAGGGGGMLGAIVKAEEAKKGVHKITATQQTALDNAERYTTSLSDSYKTLNSAIGEEADKSSRAEQISQGYNQTKSGSDNLSKAASAAISAQQAYSEAQTQGMTQAITGEHGWNLMVNHNPNVGMKLAALTQEFQNLDPHATQLGLQTGTNVAGNGAQGQFAGLLYAAQYAGKQGNYAAQAQMEGSLRKAMGMRAVDIGAPIAAEVGKMSATVTQGTGSLAAQVEPLTGTTPGAGTPAFGQTGLTAPQARTVGAEAGTPVNGFAMAAAAAPGLQGQYEQAPTTGAVGRQSREIDAAQANSVPNVPANAVGESHQGLLGKPMNLGFNHPDWVVGGGMLANFGTDAVEALTGKSLLEYAADRFFPNSAGAKMRRAARMRTEETLNGGGSGGAGNPGVSTGGGGGDGGGGASGPGTSGSDTPATGGEPPAAPGMPGPGAAVAGGTPIRGEVPPATQDGISPGNVSPTRAAEGELKGLLNGDPAADAVAGDIAEGAGEAALDSE